jgi:hypothetical protein
MESRRSLLKKLALGVGGLAFPAATAAACESVAELPAPDTRNVPPASVPDPAGAAPEAATGPSAWPLVAPLREGDAVGHGWSLDSVSPVQDGAAVVILRHAEGARDARIHVCLHRGRPIGAAFTSRLDLVLMNGGRGDEWTEESLGMALGALASVLQQNEAGARKAVAAMKTHAERLRTVASLTLS